MKRHKSPHDPEELVELLRSSSAPDEIDPLLNARLIEIAIELGTSTSATELAGADQLRAALEAPRPHAHNAPLAADPLLEVTQLLRAAARPDASPLDEFTVQRLVSAAVRPRAEPTDSADYRFDLPPDILRSDRRRPSGHIALVVTTFAAAAVVVLALRNSQPSPAPSLAEWKMESSTKHLLAAPLRVEETSQRMDKLALLRSEDLRSNRFRRWGIE